MKTFLVVHQYFQNQKRSLTDKIVSVNWLYKNKPMESYQIQNNLNLTLTQIVERSLFGTSHCLSVSMNIHSAQQISLEFDNKRWLSIDVSGWKSEYQQFAQLTGVQKYWNLIEPINIHFDGISTLSYQIIIGRNYASRHAKLYTNTFLLNYLFKRKIFSKTSDSQTNIEKTMGIAQSDSGISFPKLYSTITDKIFCGNLYAGSN